MKVIYNSLKSGRCCPGSSQTRSNVSCSQLRLTISMKQKCQVWSILPCVALPEVCFSFVLFVFGRLFGDLLFKLLRQEDVLFWFFPQFIVGGLWGFLYPRSLREKVIRRAMKGFWFLTKASDQKMAKCEKWLFHLLLMTCWIPNRKATLICICDIRQTLAHKWLYPHLSPSFLYLLWLEKQNQLEEDLMHSDLCIEKAFQIHDISVYKQIQAELVIWFSAGIKLTFRKWHC